MSLDLNFRTDDLHLKDLLSAIPRELLPQADDLVGAGRLHLVADYRGPARLTRTADLEGKLTMTDIELAHEAFKGKLEMRLAEINFSETNLTFFTDDAELAGEPMTLKVIVDNIPDPSLSAEADIDLNLSAVRQFLDPGDEVSGRLKLQATAYGKLRQPESMSLLGSLKVKDLEYYSKDLGYPVEDVDAEFEFVGKDLRIGLLQADVGESDIAATGEIRNLTPYLFAYTETETKPLYRGKVTSDYLNIDELMGEEEVPGDTGAGVPDTALFFLPDFDAEGTFLIRSGIYSLVAFEDATGKFELTDYVLHIDSVKADVYDGDAVGSAVVDIENLEQPEFQVDYSASGIEINSFLSRFTGFQDHLFGEIDMTGTFSGKGSEIEDVLPTLAARGTCNMRKGKLVNFELVKKLADPLGFKTADEEKLEDLSGSFRVTDGRVFFDDLGLTSSLGDWMLSGSVGFDGSLDYKGTVALSSDAARHLDFLGDLRSLFQDRSGKIVLPFTLTGPYAAPKVAIDTSPARENVDNKLKDEGRKLLDKLFKK
jgi:hypothetical protein